MKMKTVSILMVLMMMMITSKTQPTPTDTGVSFPISQKCTEESCGSNGKCTSVGICDCDQPYIVQDGSCSYKGKSTLITFLLSFFAGGLGVDWFYLSCGNAGYIVAGVFKLLTGGGFGIWWLVDWIRILSGSFGDGMGMELYQDM